MNCTVYAAWTLNFHFEQITTSLSQLEKSSWMKAEQAFEHEIRERPTSSATNFESSRSSGDPNLLARVSLVRQIVLLLTGVAVSYVKLV